MSDPPCTMPDGRTLRPGPRLRQEILYARCNLAASLRAIGRRTGYTAAELQTILRTTTRDPSFVMGPTVSPFLVPDDELRAEVLRLDARGFTARGISKRLKIPQTEILRVMLSNPQEDPLAS
jgi:hypothetical protein